VRHSPFTGPPPAAGDPLAKIVAMADKFLKPHRAKFDLILSLVAQEFGLSPGDLNKSTQAALPARRVAVVFAAEFLNPPLHLAVLAGWLNISEGTLYRYKSGVRRARRKDSEFETRLNQLHGRIRLVLQTNTEDKSNGQ
jgi:hypothetical protein